MHACIMRVCVHTLLLTLYHAAGFWGCHWLGWVGWNMWWHFEDGRISSKYDSQFYIKKAHTLSTSPSMPVQLLIVVPNTSDCIAAINYTRTASITFGRTQHSAIHKNNNTKDWSVRAVLDVIEIQLATIQPSQGCLPQYCCPEPTTVHSLWS